MVVSPSQQQGISKGIQIDQINRVLSSYNKWNSVKWKTKNINKKMKEMESVLNLLWINKRVDTFNYLFWLHWLGNENNCNNYSTWRDSKVNGMNKWWTILIDFITEHYNVDQICAVPIVASCIKNFTVWLMVIRNDKVMIDLRYFPVGGPPHTLSAVVTCVCYKLCQMFLWL